MWPSGRGRAEHSVTLRKAQRQVMQGPHSRGLHSAPGLGWGGAELHEQRRDIQKWGKERKERRKGGREGRKEGKKVRMGRREREREQKGRKKRRDRERAPVGTEPGASCRQAGRVTCSIPPTPLLTLWPPVPLANNGFCCGACFCRRSLQC